MAQERISAEEFQRRFVPEHARKVPTRPAKERPGKRHEDEMALQLVENGFRVLDLGQYLFLCAEPTPPEPCCFVRQYPWGLQCRPERKFRADFAAPRLRLLLEVCGGAHAAGRKRVKRDVERDGMAASLGYRVLKVTPEQVHDGSALGYVRRAMEVTDGMDS